jgi:hypothetical protein
VKSESSGWHIPVGGLQILILLFAVPPSFQSRYVLREELILPFFSG